MKYIPREIEGRSILLCAIGGGFDIFGCIPLLEELSNKNVILSSFNLNRFEEPIYDMRKPIEGYAYFPENILLGVPGLPTLNVVGKVGVSSLKEYYNTLKDRYGIDYIITIDCGIDSLMHGDEVHTGTILEECVNLAALSSLGLPIMHICVGFSTEVEESISHYRVLENISELMRGGYYYGVSGMNRDDSGYRRYKSGYELVKNHPNHKVSHIHPRIIHSVEGYFGEYREGGETLMSGGKVVFINPLMSLYWFFDGWGIIGSNRVIEIIRDDVTWSESVYRMRGIVGNRSDVVLSI